MFRPNTRIARLRPSLERGTVIVLVVFAVIAVSLGVAGFVWARSFFASWTMTNIPGAPVYLGGDGSTSNPTDGVSSGANGPASAGPLQKESYPTPVPWDGTSRVTLLVMGLDYRDWSEGKDVPRTDSMILFSMDPISKTAGILSIPRDMWVSIPGMQGYNKINTAYRWGELYKLPGGGPGLAMKTVEQFLGVPVNYYALIDFNAFVKFIDAMGGVSMKVRKPILVDPIGPGNTKLIEVGSQPMDGATALAYARQRHTDGDDFDRSTRQQEVIMAIRKDILTFNMLPELIAKSPQLYADLSSGISTNLSLDQIIQLAVLASQIEEGNIKKGVIGPPLQVQFATNPADGQAILIANPDQIRILRDDIFANGSQAAPAALASDDPGALMKAENARVVIKNGTATAGLASKTTEVLKPLGLNIVGEDNADKAYAQTTLFDYTGKPYTLKFLIETLKVPDARVVNKFDPNASADIEIYLGSDWAAQQP